MATMKKATKTKDTPVVNQALLLGAVRTLTDLTRQLSSKRRDLDVECDYTVDPTKEDFDEMYRTCGVAKRVVHILPEESWFTSPEVYETEESKSTPFETAWNDLANRLDIFSMMERADGLSGIGRFGIIFLGFRDSKNIKTEPSKKNNPLMYIRTFDESVVTVKETETDVTNERFGKPTIYEIDFAEKEAPSGKSQVVSKKLEVHWSRVIHIADNRRMSDVYGESRLKPVFNYLEDVRKILGGSAEMFWQGAFPGISFELDPRIDLDVDQIDNTGLQTQMQNYANGLQRWMYTQGLTAKSLAPNISSPTEHLECQLKAIALTLGVPYRVFLGTEEAKLASGQDAAAWAKRLMKRQQKYITPYIIRPLIERLVKYGALPEIDVVNLNIEWPSLLSPSEKDETEVAKGKTEAMKSYVQGGVDDLLPPKFFLMYIMKMTEEEADKAMEELETHQEEHADELEDDSEPGKDDGTNPDNSMDGDEG
jgi:hypothetical protein